MRMSSCNQLGHEMYKKYENVAVGLLCLLTCNLLELECKLIAN